MKSLIFTLLLLAANSISFFATAAAEEELGDTDTETQANENDTETKKDKTVILKRHIPNTENKRSTALLDHMILMKREDEIINLSNAQESFYGLYLPQASSQPQGAVLILHDKQQHGHWPEIIGPLREYLPLFGWDTLTIELPDSLKRQRIAREDSFAINDTEKSANNDNESEAAEQGGDNTSDNQNSENPEKKDNDGPEDIAAKDLQGDNPEQNNDDNEPALPRLDKLPDLPVTDTTEQIPEEAIIDLIADYQSQNRERINTAIEYLHQQNQYNLIIVGFGQGASWAVDYAHRQLQQDDEIKGLTLITIDALPNPYEEGLINQQLADMSLPYLDLLQNKKRIFDRSAKKRLAIMRRNNNSKYQQIVTQEINGYSQIENPTNRRIRGWIKKNSGGAQIPINQQP